MAVFTRVKTWVSNEVLTASDLNGEFNNLLNNTIPASIEDYSADVSTMQSTTDPGGVGTESLATTLAGELTRLRFAIKRIVGQAQWYVTAPGGRSLAASSLAILTGDIGSAQVTRAKLEAVGQQLSSSSGSFSTTNGSATDVTNLSVSITTTGRPVWVGLVGTTSRGIVSGQSTTTEITATLIYYFVRDATTICDAEVAVRSGSSAVVVIGEWPPSSFFHIDTPSSGTYTYKFQVRAGSGCTATVNNVKLIAYEL